MEFCFHVLVPVQLIAYKDSSLNDLLCVEWEVTPYTASLSLTDCGCLGCVGSGAVRIGPLRFLTGGSKSRTKSGFRLFC